MGAKPQVVEFGILLLSSHGIGNTLRVQDHFTKGQIIGLVMGLLQSTCLPREVST